MIRTKLFLIFLGMPIASLLCCKKGVRASRIRLSSVRSVSDSARPNDTILVPELRNNGVVSAEARVFVRCSLLDPPADELSTAEVFVSIPAGGTEELGRLVFRVKKSPKVRYSCELDGASSGDKEVIGEAQLVGELQTD